MSSLQSNRLSEMDQRLRKKLRHLLRLRMEDLLPGFRSQGLFSCSSIAGRSQNSLHSPGERTIFNAISQGRGQHIWRLPKLLRRHPVTEVFGIFDFMDWNTPRLSPLDGRSSRWAYLRQRPPQIAAYGWHFSGRIRSNDDLAGNKILPGVSSSRPCCGTWLFVLVPAEYCYCSDLFYLAARTGDWYHCFWW